MIALSSIYGIEFLRDNLSVAQSRMFVYYLNWYEDNFGVRLNSRNDIYKSAYYLIHKNIVRGDTLTQKNPVTGTEIRFNEWQIVKGHPSTVRRIPFVFSELLGKKAENDENLLEGQLSLFGNDDFEEKITAIEEIKIQKVYLLGD